MNEGIHVYQIVINGLMAFVGGIVRELTIKDPAECVSLGRFIAGGVIGVFSGLVTFFVCKHFGIGEYLSVALTGLAGYMGAPFLDMLGMITKRMITGLFGVHIIEKNNKEKK